MKNFSREIKRQIRQGRKGFNELKGQWKSSWQRKRNKNTKKC